MKADPGGKVIAVLGGAGGMGRHAALAATGLTGVDRVRIADRDRTAAERAAAACGPRAEALELDVADDAALRAALGEADLVLNAVGPYFRFGLPVLRAAIESGCDYLDLCDDPDPTVSMLDLSPAAARAGVRAIIGIGASPGVVNLLAVLAMRELDQVRRVVTGWNGEGATPEPGSGTAALEHGIAQATGKIPVVRDGAERRERSLRRVAIDYPGLGRRPARTFGHPEPLTLHRAFGVEESLNVTHGRRRFVAPLLALARLCDRGLLPVRRAVGVADFAERQMPSPPLGALASSRRLPPLFALAEGERDGSPAAVGVALSAMPGTSMGAVTGVPLAVAAGLLSDGAPIPPGAHSPEQALDPHEFFAALARHCPGAPAAEQMTLVTRSWDPAAPEAYRSGIDAARRRFADR
jgi:saccharopine dehydrogenase-like NADP-dependent oxidoreductase